MVKTVSQAIFLYKFPPMGLLDPLTEYLQARGGGGGLVALLGSHGPAPDLMFLDRARMLISKTLPWTLLRLMSSYRKMSILATKNFGGLDVCVDFLAFIKKVCVFFFCVKGECSQILLASFGRLFLYFPWFDVVESARDDFQPFPTRSVFLWPCNKVVCRIA